MRDALSKNRKVIIILAIIIGAGLSFYVFNALVAGGGYPPFCSGYPPSGNCHANYSYTFTIYVNYSGPWSLTFRGFHNSELAEVNSEDNYTGGFYQGNGSTGITETLSGDDYYFLTACAEAQKMDNSNSTLTLTVTGSNSTALPFGIVTYCGGVAPDGTPPPTFRSSNSQI